MSECMRCDLQRVGFVDRERRTTDLRPASGTAIRRKPSACERARERAGNAGKSHLEIHARNAHQDLTSVSKDGEGTLTDSRLRRKRNADDLQPPAQRGERVAVGLLGRVTEDRVVLRVLPL